MRNYILSIINHPGRGPRYIIVCLLALALIFPLRIVLAQTNKQKKEQLEQEMKTLRKEIAEMQSQLEKTRNEKKENLDQVEILTGKIKKREDLINNYNNQIDDLEDNINNTEKNISSQAVQIEQMKKDYAVMLRKTYSTLALQNEYSFLISASSFNEAIARYSYLKRISEYRRKKTEELDQQIKDLQHKKTNLVENKRQKIGLLVAQSDEKQKLEGEKEETDQMIAKLTDKEKKQRRFVELKNKAAQDLNEKIERIIAEEIKAARKKAEEEAKREEAKKKQLAESKAKQGGKANSAATVVKNPATPVYTSVKDQDLTADFAGNKGKLPWPVSKGTIVGTFGKHEHPTLQGVFVENNGLDIKAEDGSHGRAIFQGSVVSVFSLPTTQTCIIVKHGEYFTVYSNIAEAAVKANDPIVTKQNIGTLYTDKTDVKTTKIHIEIWKGTTKLNPAEWLSAN